MEEFKKLKKISQKILEKNIHKKINSLRDLHEKKEALKFMLISQIKLRHMEVEELINSSRDHEDFHFLILKSSLIPSKVMFLQENFQEKDFKKINTLLDELELRLLYNGFV